MECNLSIYTVMLSSNVKCFHSLERSQRYPCEPLQAVYVSPMLCMLQSISYALWIPGEVLEGDPPFVKCLPCLPMFGRMFSILMEAWRHTLRSPWGPYESPMNVRMFSGGSHLISYFLPYEKLKRPSPGTQRERPQLKNIGHEGTPWPSPCGSLMRPGELFKS